MSHNQNPMNLDGAALALWPRECIDISGCIMTLRVRRIVAMAGRHVLVQVSAHYDRYRGEAESNSRKGSQSRLFGLVLHQIFDDKESYLKGRENITYQTSYLLG